MLHRSTDIRSLYTILYATDAVANVNIGPLAGVVTFSVIMKTGNITGNFTNHVIFGNLHSKDESFRGCGWFFEVPNTTLF